MVRVPEEAVMITVHSSGGHSVDLPVSNPALTDKMIDAELGQMFDLQVNTRRKW